METERPPIIMVCVNCAKPAGRPLASMWKWTTLNVDGRQWSFCDHVPQYPPNGLPQWPDRPQR